MRVEVGGRRDVSEAATRTLGGDAAVIGLRFSVMMRGYLMEKAAVLANRHRSAQACQSTSKSRDGNSAKRSRRNRSIRSSKRVEQPSAAG
jgi:hypothetical protein